MQRQHFLCTIFLSMSMMINIVPASSASTIIQDPEPMIPFVHQKGGYGDYLAAYYAAKKYDSASAARLYNHVLSLHPSNQKIQQTTFYHSVLSGDPAAVALAPSVKGDAIATLVLGNNAIKQGHWDEAFKYFAAPPTDTFSQMTYPLLQAWCLYGAGKKDQAYMKIKQAMRGNPLNGLYLFNAGLMSELDLKDKEAGELFDKSMQLFPGTDLLFTQVYGNWLYRYHQNDKADQLLDNLVKSLPVLAVSSEDLRKSLAKLPIKNPVQAVAQVYVSMAALIQQDLSSQPENKDDIQEQVSRKIALHIEQIFLRFALQLNPDLSSAKIMLSGVLAEQDLFQEAREVLLPISDNDPLRAVMRLRVARLSALMGLYSSADQELNILAKEYPKQPDVWQTFGDLYLDQKQYQQSVDAYSKEIEFTPKIQQSDWPIFFARAIAYEKLGDWPKAEQDIQKALSLSPNEPMLLNYLGYSWLLKDKNLQEAQKILQKAVSLSPKEGAIRDSLGWAMVLNNQLPQAIKILEEASETIPQDPELNYHLGVAYWRSRRYQEAINQWNVALTCSPTPEEKKLIDEALQKAQHSQEFKKIYEQK